MDNGILLLIALVLILGAGAALVYLGRRRLPPEAVAEISGTVAAILAVMGDVIDQETAEALAGWAYDTWGSGSAYISREKFVELVLAALYGAHDKRRAAAVKAKALGLR